MTGYGKAEYLFADHKTVVEIRSVNSKQLDLSLKIASFFRDREPEIRAMLQSPLERGKVDVSIYTQQPINSEAINAQSANKRDLSPINSSYAAINWDAVRYYMDDYKANVQELQLPIGLNSRIPDEILGAIFRYPDVLQRTQTVEATLTDEEWTLLKDAVQAALDQYLAFRRQEGASLHAMFTDKLDAITTLLAEVEQYEPGRVDAIKARLIDNLSKLTGDKSTIGSEKVAIAYDKNRLEAEMIYYLEKLDITEEKVRLRNHIRYFRETMDAEGNGVGKKLGFIAQEMGREINTLGSKSNQSEMQIIVVKMKDLLEQIKEQVLNVL